MKHRRNDEKFTCAAPLHTFVNLSIELKERVVTIPTPGTYNPVAEQGYASKFGRAYLRYTMQAISLAIDIKGDDEYGYLALERACAEIAATIPRFPPPKKEESDDESDDAEAKLEDDAGAAELRLEEAKQSAKEKAQAQIGKVMRASIMKMIEAGCTREDVADAVDGEYLTVMSWAASEIDRRETEAKNKPANEAEQKTGAADYHDNDSLENTNIIVSTEESMDLLLPYSRQNDEYIARA